jgi:hypothetical protein
MDSSKREDYRHTLSLHMEVYRGGKSAEPIFKCRTRNLGLGGAMIRNRGFKLRKGARLKLLLKASCRSVRKQYAIDAKVVWKTPSAIGVQFFPEKGAEAREFRKFLFEAKVSSHARERERWAKRSVPALVATLSD